MPQIEQEPLITFVTHRRKPAGFAPLAPHWEPRIAAFKTLDADSAEGLCPYSSNTPATLYNCPPEDQQLPEPPRQGDRLQLKGWYDDAPWLDLALPEPGLEARIVPNQGDSRRVRRLEPIWDTLVIDTTEQRLDLIFRLGIPDTKALAGAQLVLSSAPEPEGQSAATADRATMEAETT